MPNDSSNIYILTDVETSYMSLKFTSNYNLLPKDIRANNSGIDLFNRISGNSMHTDIRCHIVPSGVFLVGKTLRDNNFNYSIVYISQRYYQTNEICNI